MSLLLFRVKAERELGSISGGGGSLPADGAFPLEFMGLNCGGFDLGLDCELGLEGPLLVAEGI